MGVMCHLTGADPRVSARPPWVGPPVSIPCSLARLHAPEADVRHAGVRRTPVAGAGPVARAVAVVAQERAALLDPQRGVGLAGVETLLRAGGVDNDSLAGPLAVQVHLVPVTAPLPDVAGHVVEAVAVRREGLDRRGAHVAVGGGVRV